MFVFWGLIAAPNPNNQHWYWTEVLVIWYCLSGLVFAPMWQNMKLSSRFFAE
jgi:hypothetical protein